MIRCRYIVPFLFLTPQWKAKSQLYLCAGWDTWSLKCSKVQLDNQKRKSVPILFVTEAKNAHFFVCKRTGYVHQRLRDFVKRTLTQVLSHWLWLESSHSAKNVIRVESPFFSTWLESSHWLESRYHWLVLVTIFVLLCYSLVLVIWTTSLQQNK